MGAHPVGPQVEHLLLEQVFHVPARTVELFVKPRRLEAPAIGVAFKSFGRQIGHYKARIFTLGQHFGFANDPAWATPTLPGLIFKLRKGPDAGRTAEAVTRSGLRLSRPQFLNQHGVLGPTQAIKDLRLPLAPGQDWLPAKTAVSPHDDPCLATTLANGRYDLLQRRNYPVSGLMVGGAQLRP